MKKINGFITIVIIFIFYWIFFYKPKEEKIKIKREKLSFRKKKEVKEILENKCNYEINSIKEIGNDSILVVPYEENSKVLYEIYNYNFTKKIREIKNLDNDIVLLNKKIQNIYFTITENKNKAKLILIPNDINQRGDTVLLNFVYDTFYDIDSSFIYYSNQSENKFVLYKYSIKEKRNTDSFEISKILETEELQKALVLFGRLAINNGNIIFKSIYSSEGMILNNNFKTIKKFITKDSFELPKVKNVEIAKGVYQNTIEPSIYPAWQLIQNKDSSFYLLSFLGLNKNATYIDLYSKNGSYLYSYEIPMFEKYKPYWIDISRSNKFIKILFDDYKTVKTYEIL